MPENTVEYVDYANQALSEATPGEGSLELFPYEIVKHFNKQQKTSYNIDKCCAKWLHKTFGGNLKMLQPSNEKKQGDFLWNGKVWELKTFSGAKIERISDKFRRATHQSLDRCIIIDITKKSLIYEDINLDKLKEYARIRGVKELIVKRDQNLVAYLKAK
jgi:hypothetical protein